MSIKSPEAVDVHVGHRIRLFRTQAGISQEKLGAELGLTFQQVQKYEKGTNRVSASKLWAIAKVLGVKVSDLFDGYDDAGAPFPSNLHQLSKQGIEVGTAYDKASPAQRQALRAIIETFGVPDAAGA